MTALNDALDAGWFGAQFPPDTYGHLVQRHRYAQWVEVSKEFLADAGTPWAEGHSEVRLKMYLAENHLRRDSAVTFKVSDTNAAFFMRNTAVVLAECWALGCPPDRRLPPRRTWRRPHPLRRLRSFARRHTGQPV